MVCLDKLFGITIALYYGYHCLCVTDRLKCRELKYHMYVVSKKYND